MNFRNFQNDHVRNVTLALQKAVFEFLLILKKIIPALVEELVIGYITDTTRAALEIGKPNKITLEDITYVIRKDKRKGKRFTQMLRNRGNT